MDKDFHKLLKDFKIISRKKWIEGITNGHGNIGLTFENQLNKHIDDNYTPDYLSIELKSTTRFSRYPLTLFSVAFDGPTEKEIIRLNETYGTYDKDFPNKKTLIRKIRVNELSLINTNYYLSLTVENNKLYLCVYDNNKNLIEKESYVNISTIKKHLLTKLKKLAIIKASKKNINNKEYFRYYEINFYILKSFSKFLELLKNGDIEVSLISRIQKSGINVGNYNNKNIVFQIKKKNIEKLFNKIYSYNNDIRKSKNEMQFL